MGKGNFILGTGSSSIGDVTFARRNGQQIARVRVRKIKNPKSYGQAEQRMISAEVVKFYSPLSNVLETSFEGLSKSESYAKFLSINMNLARANGWAVKKGSGFVALPFQLSAGSLPQAEIVNTALKIEGNEILTTFGTLSSAIKSKYNLQEGDQVTFIAVDDLGKIYYNRFYIDTTSTVALPSSYAAENGKFSYVPDDALSVAFGVIFSRWDGSSMKWARSTAFLSCTSSYMNDYTGDANLAAAISSYMNAGGHTPVSEVFLNGQDD